MKTLLLMTTMTIKMNKTMEVMVALTGTVMSWSKCLAVWGATALLTLRMMRRSKRNEEKTATKSGTVEMSL